MVDSKANDSARAPERLRDKMTETRENIVDMGHLAKEAVTDKLHDLKDRASEKYDEGKEKLHDFEESLLKSVRKSPMKSVLIAAGVGLAIGCLWGRR
jgi:ElaB/YqjD/DUF883 family membrane-anchored ribosome-binding protein